MHNRQWVISNVAYFVSCSAQRVSMLKLGLEQLGGSEIRWRHIILLCEMKWVERHDTVLSFELIYDGISRFFFKCQDPPNAEITSKAQT